MARLNVLSTSMMACWAFGIGIVAIPSTSAHDVTLDRTAYDPSCGVTIEQDGANLRITWPIRADRHAAIRFDLDEERPLIRSIAIAPVTPEDRPDTFRPITEGLDPTLWVRVGPRDLELRDGWTVFFDRMQRKPSEQFPLRLDRSRAVVESRGNRLVLTIGKAEAGPFRGALRWTFVSGEPFVLQEAVLSTERPDAAYLYDVGLVPHDDHPVTIHWRDVDGTPIGKSPEAFDEFRALRVRGRTVAAEFEGGSLALYPPPHRYFYPLDFSNNEGNVWIGPYNESPASPFSFGIRHDPRGDDRFVPWFNAPPGTRQEMGVFLQISDGSASELLDDVAKLTRHDRFERLDGYRTFTSHYHIEHATELIEALKADPQTLGATTEGQRHDGTTYPIPERLRDPGFVRAFKARGVDIAHLAEFHFGVTPRWDREERIENLQLLHAECARLSDPSFLLLPGEEPNVHFGGHWISLFPRPVYWVLNRPDGVPFLDEHPTLGTVYHVGNQTDVLNLLREEAGLAWTAHPRIKGSTGFPDRHRTRPFFRSDRFLGAAWKAMPADLSEPRLGRRVLDLMDDMANWGDPKYVLGEVDTFKLEPDHELYAHMNINYLRLDQIPRFEDGWQPVLNALRTGSFFVTTGEVLIPEFNVNGARSGQTLKLVEDGRATIALDLQWTFPLAYVEVISGDGRDVFRERFDLDETSAFDRASLTFDVDLNGRSWVRVEVWDLATNGAFTQLVWIERSEDFPEN